MLSFMLFISGILELYGIAKYDRSLEGKEAKEEYLALCKVVGDKSKSNEERKEAFGSVRAAPIFGDAMRSLFEGVTMVAAAFFAFKATLFLLLPIWILSIAENSSLNWKENKFLFILDHVFCATMFFVAAWVVA